MGLNFTRNSSTTNMASQKAVEVLEGDTPETLQRRVMEQAEWILLPQAAEKVCAEL